MNVQLVKFVHIVAVSVSFALFFVRGLWVLRSYPSPQEQWVRYLPSTVDTIIVASALFVLWSKRSQGWPGDWLSIKLMLLAVYLGLAIAGLNLSRELWAKLLAWVAALLLFLFITTIAVLHDSRGLLALI